MRTLHRSLLALSSLALLLIGGAVPVAATSPAAIAPSPAGWVVVRSPSLDTYHPAAKDRGNSTGGDVTVERTGTGAWTVTWAGLGAAGGGVLQVSALGSQLRHCIAYTWGQNNADGYGEIRCYKRSSVALDQYGESVDAPFVAVLVGEDGPVAGSQGRMGYAWMDLATSSGTPDVNYNYANPGGHVTSAHTGTGTYTVTVPGVGKADGVVLVTGYEGDLSRCQVRSWGLGGADLKARVDCVDLRGVLADNRFDFLYLRRIGLEGYGSKVAASLLANRPTTARYHPAPLYTWSTNGKEPAIRRTAKGVYTVTLPGMPSGGAAIVTAYGPTATPHACQLGSIRTTGTPQKIVVRCFTYNGAPADSQFVLSYTH